MKHFYFFETSNQLRDGVMKNTLRALPGQTFPDGTPVDSNLNVQSPKDNNHSQSGTRTEYPIGTKFCSDHLELTGSGKKFYTVYDGSKGESPTGNPPTFYPVSEDNNFKFKSIFHKNDEMNLAYVYFLATGSQDYENTPRTPTAPVSKPSPKKKQDTKQKDTPWTEQYEGQLETETNIFISWIKNLMTKNGVKPAARILAKGISEDYENLRKSGETIETVASTNRFQDCLDKNHLTYGFFENNPDGPHKWYIKQLLNQTSQYNPRKTSDMDEMKEAESIARNIHEAVTGNDSSAEQATTGNLIKALEDGWTMDEIINPNNILKSEDFDKYIQDLAAGNIQRQQVTKKKPTNDKLLLSKLLADPKNARPKDEEGFHISKRNWDILINNLYDKTPTLITGPSGSGKTEMIKILCDRTGTPYTIIQMGSITDPNEQLVGKMDLDETGTTTHFDWAEFALAIQRPGVIILDEINRIPKNGENILFSCLDGTKELKASGAKSTDQRTIKVHPECVFFATANIGAEYTATRVIDQAIMTRFMIMETKYMELEEEKNILLAEYDITPEEANIICLVAATIRQQNKAGTLHTSVSTRETKRCARYIENGFQIKDALEIHMLPLFEEGTDGDPESDERSTVRQIISDNFNNIFS